MGTDWQLTQLRAEKLQALINKNWKEVNRLDKMIASIEKVQKQGGELYRSLWPNAQVKP